MSDYKDYLEEEATFVKFSARPSIRWNGEEWGIYISLNDGNASQVGAMFSLEQAEEVAKIVQNAVADARTKPVPHLLSDEEF